MYTLALKGSTTQAPYTVINTLQKVVKATTTTINTTPTTVSTTPTRRNAIDVVAFTPI